MSSIKDIKWHKFHIEKILIFGISFFLQLSATTEYQYAIQTTNYTCSLPCQEVFTDIAYAPLYVSNIKNINRISKDGYLILKNGFYSSEEYCITKRISKAHVLVKVCKRYCLTDDFKRPCIPKCCSWEESVKLDKKKGYGGCKPLTGPWYTWSPTYYDSKRYRQKLTDEQYKNFHPRYYPVKNTEFQCTAVWIRESSQLQFHLMQNGDIRWKYSRINKWFKVSHNVSKESPTYCVDNKENSNQLVLKVCFEDLLSSVKRYTNMFSCMAFFSVFLIFWILLTTALLWDKQNSHGWIQFLFFLSLFFYYLCEGLGLIIYPTDFFCYLLSVAHHFFTTLTTTTLATVSWDIFLTFWKMYPAAGQHKCMRRFYNSAIVSCGTATLVVCVGVVLNLTDSPGSTNYGFLLCIGTYWIVGLCLQGLFVVFSISMFILTAAVIFKHKADSKFVVDVDRSFYTDLAMVFVKLMLVQGLTWTSVMLFNFLNYFQHRLRYDFFIRVIYNGQSLLFFFLFGCDRRKLKSLQDKYPRFKAFSNALCSYCCLKNCKSDGGDDPNSRLLQTR